MRDLHVVGAAVAVEQRDAVLVEGWLALGVEALVVELHARRVCRVARQDLGQLVVGLAPRGLVEERAPGRLVELRTIQRVDGADAVVVLGGRRHDAWYALAEVVELVVLLGLDLLVGEAIGPQLGLQGLVGRGLEHEPRAAQRDEKAILERVVHRNPGPVHVVEGVAKHSAEADDA